MKDQTIRSAEVEFFCTEIDPLYEKNHKLKILDVGSGNGYLLSVLRDKYPEALLYGVEFTPELHQLAIDRDLDIDFIHGD